MKQEITIKCMQFGATHDDDREVEVTVLAECYEGLAVHKTIGRRGYTVVHIHSMYPLVQIDASEKRACSWMYEAAGKFDFTQKDILLPCYLQELLSIVRSAQYA